MRINREIRRRIDGLGRIVIPVHMRRMLQVEPGDELDVFYDNGEIIMRSTLPACAICGTHEDLVDIDQRYVCHQCAARVAAIVAPK